MVPTSFLSQACLVLLVLLVLVWQGYSVVPGACGYVVNRRRQLSTTYIEAAGDARVQIVVEEMEGGHQSDAFGCRH